MWHYAAVAVVLHMFHSYFSVLSFYHMMSHSFLKCLKLVYSSFFSTNIPLRQNIFIYFLITEAFAKACTQNILNWINSNRRMKFLLYLLYVFFNVYQQNLINCNLSLWNFIKFSFFFQLISICFVWLILNGWKDIFHYKQQISLTNNNPKIIISLNVSSPIILERNTIFYINSIMHLGVSL